MFSARALIAATAALALPPVAALRALREEPPAALVFVSGPEPETLDPALATAVLEARLLSALFEGLVAIDPKTLEPRPAAAESFSADRDGRHFAFTLRGDLAFSDGTPLGPDDFLYAWRRAADPATGAPMRDLAALVAKRARISGPRTIEIALSEPRPDLLAALSLPVFYPLERRTIETWGEHWTRPGRLVSNGPFRLEAWEIGRRLRLCRNEHYRGGAASLASIEALTTSGAAIGEGAAFDIYETGGADLVFSVPAGGALRLFGRPDFHAGPALRTIFLRFNLRRAPLNDPALRRALSATIDREAIARRVLRNGERPAFGLVPPGLPGYEPLGPLPADPEEIEAVRRASRSLRALELSYAAGDEAAASMAEILEARWRTGLGVALRLRPIERKVFYSAIRRGEYDIAFGNWAADYPDPANFLEILRSGSGNNRTGFFDSRYDALLDRAARATDEGARRALFLEAESLLWREAPIAPIAYAVTGVLCRERVRGFCPNPLNLVDWAALSVAEGP